MKSSQFNLMVALVARGDEKQVIQQSVLYAERFNARLTVIHINQPALSQPKGAVEKTINETDIKNRFIEYGFEYFLENLDIIIEYGEGVSEIIKKYSDDMNLIVLGHRKMSLFKSHIMDSVDEGIINLVSCPVLVVQKL